MDRRCVQRDDFAGQRGVHHPKGGGVGVRLGKAGE